MHNAGSARGPRVALVPPAQWAVCVQLADNYNRATLFLIQEWLNTKFTATGAMTAAFQRELQADPAFVWDNKLWDRKWGYEMTVAERTAHSCPYDRNIHG